MVVVVEQVVVEVSQGVILLVFCIMEKKAIGKDELKQPLSQCNYMFHSITSPLFVFFWYLSGVAKLIYGPGATLTIMF